MADEKNLDIETTDAQELAEHVEEPGTDRGRRDFFRAAAASAMAGTAALAFTGNAEAQVKKAPTARPVVRDFKAKLSPEQVNLSKEELTKDVKLKMAAELLSELDNVEIKWVKGAIPGTRRVIQIKG